MTELFQILQVAAMIVAGLSITWIFILLNRQLKSMADENAKARERMMAHLLIRR